MAAKGDIYPYEIEIDKYLKSKLFQFELPNSYSIENFDLEKFQIKLGKASSADQAACLTEITARSIFKSIENFCPIKKASVYLCGGGAENKFLVSRLKILLGSSFPIKNINTLGLKPKYMEQNLSPQEVHEFVKKALTFEEIELTARDGDVIKLNAFKDTCKIICTGEIL